MLGTWFSGIGAFSAVLYALHSNKPKLNINFRGQSNLEIVNNQSVNAHINYIRLEFKNSFFKYLPPPSKFSPNRILMDYVLREDEVLGLKVLSGDLVNIKLNTDNIYRAYFKKHEYRQILIPRIMPKLQICIYLAGGKKYILDMPIAFYKDVQERNIYKPKSDLQKLYDKNTKINFSSNQQRDQIYKDNLDCYIAAYRADQLWKTPKSIFYIRAWKSLIG